MDRIFRWTVGDTSDIGLSILEESIRVAKMTLSHLNLKFIVCFNSSSRRIERICLEHGVDAIRSRWDDFPLPSESVSLRPEDSWGSFCNNLDCSPKVPRGRQGSFWKMCPPRIDLESHEIVCDNDVLIQEVPEEMERFFHEKKTLACEDEILCLGKYTRTLGKPFNSGLYGLPPGFDFGRSLVRLWKENESMRPMFSRDEQGLIGLTLNNHPGGSIIIPIKKVCMAFNEGKPVSANYEKTWENGHETQRIIHIDFEKCRLDRPILHFIGANRRKFHRYWSIYKIKAM